MTMKLTSKRCSDDVAGYRSTAKKDELVQRLGELEHQVPDMLDEICDKCCRWPYTIRDQARMTEICDACAITAAMLRLGE